MKSETILKFKNLFEEQRANLMFANQVVDQSLAIQVEDLSDEVDLTSSELATSMRMRLRNRETLFARKIDEALKRIQEGTFGQCMDCEDEIEMRRLEARPTTTQCVHCKEAAEHREHIHIDGHRRKSLGARLKLA